MNIYRIYHKVDGFKAIKTKDTALERRMLEYGNNATFELFKNQQFQWSDSTGEKICDFPFIDGNITVFSENVFTAIRSMITSCAVITNIVVEGTQYEIIEANKIRNVLDTEQSVIKRFKDGRIMNIKKYVFKQNSSYPAMFRIEEFPTFTFVTEDVLDKIMELSEIEGLDFQLCEVV